MAAKKTCLQESSCIDTKATEKLDFSKREMTCISIIVPFPWSEDTAWGDAPFYVSCSTSCRFPLPDRADTDYKFCNLKSKWEWLLWKLNCSGTILLSDWGEACVPVWFGFISILRAASTISWWRAVRFLCSGSKVILLRKKARQTFIII